MKDRDPLHLLKVHRNEKEEEEAQKLTEEEVSNVLHSNTDQLNKHYVSNYNRNPSCYQECLRNVTCGCTAREQSRRRLKK